jgi:prevent-host-death family protein
MKTVNIQEAKTQLSKLVEEASRGEPFVIAKAGKPIVKVTALSAPVGAQVYRLGFMAGQVGHSYGGVVVTEAGNDPKVAGLVYIAAFAPDSGESVETLIKNPPPGASVPPILPPQDGFLFLDRSKFAVSFAADVNPALAGFVADSQVPWGVQRLSGMVGEPAWKSKPSGYLVSTDDKMIPPDAQRCHIETRRFQGRRS